MTLTRIAGGTRVTRLAVTRLRPRAVVTLECVTAGGRGKGPGCPFASRRLKARNGAANGAPLLRLARLRTGAALRVRVTTPGFLTRIRTARLGPRPVVTDRCQAPGATTTRRCR